MAALLKGFRVAPETRFFARWLGGIKGIVSPATQCLTLPTLLSLQIHSKANIISSLDIGCRCALPNRAIRIGRNQHAAAGCDLKQKIEGNSGLSSCGALAYQHPSGGNGPDRDAQTAAGATGKDDTQQPAINTQPGFAPPERCGIGKSVWQ